MSNTNVAIPPGAKKDSYGPLANNEYTNVEDERNDTGMEKLPPGHHKTPSSQARIGGPNIQLESDMPL